MFRVVDTNKRNSFLKASNIPHVQRINFYVPTQLNKDDLVHVSRDSCLFDLSRGKNTTVLIQKEVLMSFSTSGNKESGFL